MKRIALFLAAAAATLASCVKENTIAPEQTGDNLVTITALATKTTLDGTSVVWNAGDEIGVVYNINLDEIPVFSTTGSGSSVKFTGAHPDGYMETTSAYAVYPSSAVTLEGGVVKVSHNLPAEQDGTIDRGMNLSFAELDVDDLKAGSGTATFKNALTLLKVVVPAGVKEVSLTSNSETLVGDAEFYAPQLGEMGRKSVSNGGKTVTLIKGGSDLEGTHYLLVYPANTNGLDLRMVGSDDTVYESTAASIKFLPSEYRTIDLTKVFKMETESTMRISPAGGELIVPVYTVADYTYEVVETADWLSYTLPTKGFHKDEIVFSAEANETGAERSAEVTITWGESQTRTFTIAQSAIFMDFVNDANGDPIKWEETFGLYGDEALSNELASFTNVFTIALSDDFSKGTYKVSNLFMVDAYYGEGYQQITNKGGEYYANYDVAKKELTILKENSVSGYTFTGNVVLTYDVANKTFSAGKIPATLLTLSKYYNSGATRYIGNYAADVKVDEPGAGGDLGDAAKVLGNTYKESYSLSEAYGNTPGNLVFEESDDLSKGNVKITNIFGCQATGMYATVSGNTITTIESAYINTLQGTNPIGQLILTIGDDGNITMINQPLYNFYYLENYVATKQGGSVTVDNIVGDTWVQDWATNSGLSKNKKVSITKIDDTHVSISNMFDYVTISSATFDPSAMTLTVPAGWSHPYGAAGDNPELVFNVSDDFNTLTLTGQYSIGGYMSVTDYVLTR